MSNERIGLLSRLVGLTLFFIAWQLFMFFVHYNVSNLLDSLSEVSIAKQILYPVILLPVISFIIIQLIVYALLVAWIWFIAVSCGEKLTLSSTATRWLGIACWASACSVVLALNGYYYPDSFFAELIAQTGFLRYVNMMVVVIASALLMVVTFFACANFFLHKRHKILGGLFVMLVVSIVLAYGGSQFSLSPVISAETNSKPDIILIGLDSLRPDFTGYYGNKITHTPNIDHFLKTASTFTNTYTPLSRTFVSWMSILTSKHPLHSHARVNLADPSPIIANDTLAKKLKSAGYMTIYGIDETSFSNITKDYGFDRIIGPRSGAAEFVLSGLSDFPLTNLLINMPFGRWLFPYNYGNRADAIVYKPENFLQLVKNGIANRPHQPVFLAVHLCLAHWPYTWAQEGEREPANLPEKYRRSVEAVDKQFGQLMQILQANGLLKNSLVVLLSDHGTTLGMPGDRIIARDKYVGDASKLKLLSVYRLTSAPEFSTDFKKDYTISTSYGQGTDLLSLKQNHALLAFKRFAPQQTKVAALPYQRIAVRSSLLDVAPTILAFLDLAPIQQSDGISLRDYFFKNKSQVSHGRSFFMETGDSMTEIETDHIRVDQVVKQGIGAYQINPATGLLSLTLTAQKAVIENKQHSIMRDDWLLVRYPAWIKTTLDCGAGNKSSLCHLKSTVAEPYYVLANLKTGQWTVGASSQFAKSSPFVDLQKRLEGFYGNEVTQGLKPISHSAG